MGGPVTTKFTLASLDNCRRELRIEVPPDQLAPRMEATFQELGRTVRVPGFRPGKVPRAILERRFRDHVRDEVMRQAIPEHLTEAVREAQVAPLGPPTVDEVTWNEGEPLRFRAVVEVRPAVTVKDYLGVALAREKVQVEDAEVDRALEVLREDAATYTPMEGWPALQEDLVVIDHEGTINGKPVKGGSAQNVNVILGAGRYLPGFEEALRGMSKGQVKEFDVDVPPDSPRKELAGRRVHFRVAVREVKKKRVPELNDDLAKELGEGDTLAALKEKVRERLAARKQRDQEAELKGRLMEKIGEANPVDLPEGLVQHETEHILEELAQALGPGLRRAQPGDLEALRRQAGEMARRRVRSSLLLEAIARQEGLTVGEEELEAEVKQMAAVLRQDQASLRKTLEEEEGRLEAIRGRLLERKAMDLVWNRAQLTETMNLVQLA
jgi:trigger factor